MGSSIKRPEIASLELTFNNASLVANKYVASHNLNSTKVIPVLKTPTGNMCFPDEFEYTDVDTITIDMTSYVDRDGGTLSGTYTVLFMGGR